MSRTTQCGIYFPSLLLLPLTNGEHGTGGDIQRESIALAQMGEKIVSTIGGKTNLELVWVQVLPTSFVKLGTFNSCLRTRQWALRTRQWAPASYTDVISFLFVLRSMTRRWYILPHVLPTPMSFCSCLLES